VSCGNKPIAQIARQDLIDFESYLRREDLSDRTIHNRMVEVTTLLLSAATISIHSLQNAWKAFG
jgi:hypothetical protein